MKRIAVLTSGGDAPGMNAAIRAVVRTALGRGATVAGYRHGFDGLLDGEFVEMDSVQVGGIISRGGTVLRSGRCKRFLEPSQRKLAIDGMAAAGVEGLVVIGGDGSLTGAHLLATEHGFPIYGIPGSIDNDIFGTDPSIGFDTAINTALDAIDRVRDTAYSHDRVFVIEVMGRKHGFIALEAGLAGGAEAILIPEIPFSLQEVCSRLDAGTGRGKKSSIIVVAEGAGKANDISAFIQKHSGYESRELVLGHMQRGGNPTAFDRVLATRIGAYAATRLLNGHADEMAGFMGQKMVATPLGTVLSSEQKIDPEKLLLAEVMAQ